MAETNPRNKLAFTTTKAIEMLRQESQDIQDAVAKERNRIFDEGDDEKQGVSNTKDRQTYVISYRILDHADSRVVAQCHRQSATYFADMS